MSFNMNLRGADGAGIGNTQTGSTKIPKGFSQGQLPNFTPQQFQLFQQLFSNVGPESFLGKLAGGDQSQFEEIEKPALRQFQELQGNLSSRFSGMGSGARRSSGFQNAANQATQDFASQLHSQRLGYRQQALRDLMEMSGQLLGQRPYEQFLVQNAPKPMSFLKQLALTSAGGLASGVGSGGILGLSKLFGGSQQPQWS